MCIVDVVAYYRANLPHGETIAYPSKEKKCAYVFWEVKLGNVNTEVKWNCATLEKSLSLHAFHGHNPWDPTTLATR